MPVHSVPSPPEHGRRRKLERLAASTLRAPEVVAWLALARRVLGIPPDGFGSDEVALAAWHRAARDDPRGEKLWQRQPEVSTLLWELGPIQAVPDPRDEYMFVVPPLSPRNALHYASIRVANLGELDARWIDWARHLITSGMSDISRVRSWKTLYIQGLCDPEGRVFPRDVDIRELGDAYSEDIQRVEETRVLPLELRRAKDCILDQKLETPNVSWLALALSPAGETYCASKGKANASNKEKRDTVRNFVLANLEAHRRARMKKG